MRKVLNSHAGLELLLDGGTGEYAIRDSVAGKTYEEPDFLREPAVMAFMVLAIAKGIDPESDLGSLAGLTEETPA